METTRTIIGELEREQRGEQFTDPEAFVQALKTRALELHIQSAVSVARGQTQDLMHVTVSGLTAVRPEQEEEARGIGAEQLMEQLKQAEAGHESEAPAVVARALHIKAEEVRALLEGRQADSEQGSLAA